MTGRILRPPGGRYSILDIAQEDRDKIAEVGTLAKRILSTQNQEVWAQAGDPHLLQRALAGAIVLERIGEQIGAVLVEDDGAHLAFMACCSLTLFAKDLDRSSLRILGETLKTLSMACPVKTKS